MNDCEFSVILESFTSAEGGDRDRFRKSLRTILGMLPDNAEVLVTDVYQSAELVTLLANEFPSVRRVSVVGQGYDSAKTSAAMAARGQFVLFLDGDCVPEPGWHELLLAPLRSGEAVACGGYTRYEGGFLAAMMSVMDFGFFYPLTKRNLVCYASNNCGFVRTTYLDVPVPEANLRCRCFYHAQCLLRRGTPVLLIPEARVLHEAQPFLRERSRQGYDSIAAAWADPELPEARWLKIGIFSLPLFYCMNVFNDWKRVCAGRKDLGLGSGQLLLALLLFPMFRLVDVLGMIRAFVGGSAKEGWGGFEFSSPKIDGV